MRLGRHVWLLFVVLCLGLGGCGKRRRKSEPPGPKIKKVQVEGTNTLSEDDVLTHINLQPSKAFGEKHYYVPGLEVIDEERILQLYESYGHYQAKVNEITVDVRKKDKKVKRQRARVRISLEEGPGTSVRGVAFEWTDPIDHGVDLDRKKVETAAGLKVGDAFTMPALTEASARVQLAVMEQGYPFASVQETAKVDRDRGVAEVSIAIVPGERVKIGRIDIRGLKRVREDLVRREVNDGVGRVYSPRLIRSLESAIYGLQVFSAVNVEVGEPIADGEVALTISVTEQKMQQISVGLLLDVDPVFWSQRAGFRYRHNNAFRNLSRFETKLLAGWAELPTPWQIQAHGPRVELDFKLSKRGMLERRLLWEMEPKLEVEIREGFQLWGIRNRLGVSRLFGRFASLGLSYNNRFGDFFNVEPDLRDELRQLEAIVRDPYIVSFLEVQGELFILDNIGVPARGARLLVTYQFANRYLGSHFDYHQVEPELRLYYDPHPRIHLGARAGVGFILPYRTTETAPVDLKFYLGGGNDVRGWPLRRLSPRVDICEDDDPEDCQTYPVGGNTKVLGNLEMRVRTFGQVWWAIYGDVGDVQAATAVIRPAQWMYSAGTGLRYATPIGPLRLDFGIRINRDDQRFPEPRIWAIHFSLGEAF